MFWKLLYWLMVCLLFAHLAVDHVSAAIIITEIAPAPSTGKEWIELYNTATETIDLSGWSISDLLATPSVLFTFPADSTALILPNSFKVIEFSSAKLNNSGDGVVVHDQLQQLITSASYTTSTPGFTWGLTSPLALSLFEALPSQNAFTPLPSLVPSPSLSPSPTLIASPNPSNPASPQPSNSSREIDPSLIKLSAFHPCPPIGTDEWIQLSSSDTQSISLHNWTITDNSGNIKLLVGTLEPLLPLTLSWKGSLLNNSGDSFTIRTETGQIITSASYDSCDPLTPIEPEHELTKNTLYSELSSSQITKNNASDASMSAILDESNSIRTPPQVSSSRSISSSTLFTLPPIKRYTTANFKLYTEYQKLWTQSARPKFAILGVILGGSCLLSGSFIIVRKKQNEQVQIPTFYIENV